MQSQELAGCLNLWIFMKRITNYLIKEPISWGLEKVIVDQLVKKLPVLRNKILCITSHPTLILTSHLFLVIRNRLYSWTFRKYNLDILFYPLLLFGPSELILLIVSSLLIYSCWIYTTKLPIMRFHTASFTSCFLDSNSVFSALLGTAWNDSAVEIELKQNPQGLHMPPAATPCLSSYLSHWPACYNFSHSQRLRVTHIVQGYNDSKKLPHGQFCRSRLKWNVDCSSRNIR